MEVRFHKELETLVGRTVVKAVSTGRSYGEMVLMFDDGSIAVFEVETGYDAGDIDLVLSDDLGESTQVELGLASREAYEARKLAEKQAADIRRQDAERRQYEALKRKFEPGQSSQ